MASVAAPIAKKAISTATTAVKNTTTAAISSVKNAASNFASGVKGLVGGLFKKSAPAPASSKIDLQLFGNKVVNGNSKASTKLQHGYEIHEKSTGDVVKTGISGQTLNKNGTSPRANSQVNKLNKQAGYDKYEANIVKSNIPNRQSALNWEKRNAQKLWDEGNSMNLHKRPRPGIIKELINWY